MRLNFIAENIVANLTANQNKVNIIYDPIGSMLDHIIFELPYHFYVFGNNTTNFYRNNVVDLPNRLYDIYNYNLYVSHSIEKIAGENLATAYQIPAVVLIDQIKQYKKEDRHIINQKTKHVTKIFLSDDAYESMNRPEKSFVLNPGIPTPNDTLLSQPKNNGVLFLDSTPITQQLKQLLESQNVDCHIISLNTNIDNISNIISQYKFCVDFSINYKTNLLYALSLGAQPITLEHNPKFCPFIQHIRTPQELLHSIAEPTMLADNKHREYLNMHHNYITFIDKLTDIFKHLSKEVFIQ
jgi:hypothetical protein